MRRAATRSRLEYRWRARRSIAPAGGFEDPRRLPSVCLRLQPYLVQLLKLQRRAGEEHTRLPVVLIVERDAQEVALAVANIPRRRGPGDRHDRVAIDVVAVVLVRVDGEGPVDLLDQVVDVDLNHRAESGRTDGGLAQNRD